MSSIIQSNYIQDILFEWDEQKNLANIKKHLWSLGSWQMLLTSDSCFHKASLPPLLFRLC